MVEIERENGNTSPVDSLLIENVFHLLVALLTKRGDLKERDGRTEIVATVPDGLEISITSPYSLNDLQKLSRDGRRIEDIILGGASRVRVSKGEVPAGADEFTLVRFDPGQLRTIPEETWKLDDVVHQEVQYLIEGQGTPESLAAKVNQMIAGVKQG
jgi:hypothetical protein